MDDPAFLPIEPVTDDNTLTILLHASNHDLQALKPFLRVPGNANVQDPETGYTPLHAAIAACGPASTSANTETPKPGNGIQPSVEQTNEEAREDEEEVEEAEEEQDEYGSVENAKAVVQELFLSGAIWNDLDSSNETPGCLAYRLGHKELYDLCVNAGVRAEMLLGLMGGYEVLGDEDSEEEEVVVDMNASTTDVSTEGEMVEAMDGVHELAVGPAEGEVKKDVNSEDYLASSLTFTNAALIDSDANGVMMAWETDIMRRTVDLLIPDLKPGARVLNIGFGMGIIDRMFRDTKPSRHHIIEAHPAVLEHLASPASDFSKSWEESAPSTNSYKVHVGRWQEVAPKLLEKGEVFDAIYFDTFGEDYSQLKFFFTEIVPGLLDSNGRFGFFNGLGADRRVCYDVYTKVSELDLCDVGMDVEWTDVDVPLEGMEEAGEGEWKGVKRRYWTLEKYKLPICTFLG